MSAEVDLQTPPLIGKAPTIRSDTSSLATRSSTPHLADDGQDYREDSETLDEDDQPYEEWRYGISLEWQVYKTRGRLKYPIVLRTNAKPEIAALRKPIPWCVAIPELMRLEGKYGQAPEELLQYLNQEIQYQHDQLVDQWGDSERFEIKCRILNCEEKRAELVEAYNRIVRDHLRAQKPVIEAGEASHRPPEAQSATTQIETALTSKSSSPKKKSQNSSKDPKSRSAKGKTSDATKKKATKEAKKKRSFAISWKGFQFNFREEP